MKPAELYARKPERISNDLNDLSGGTYGSNFPEIHELSCSYWFDDVSQDLVQIHIYKDHCFDGRRVWQLKAIYFESKPVMITRNAGREGDDHCSRFITNKSLFIKMVTYIKSMTLSEDEFDGEIFSPDIDINNLENFYGNKLNSFDEEHY